MSKRRPQKTTQFSINYQFQKAPPKTQPRQKKKKKKEIKSRLDIEQKQTLNIAT
jgi:hypothetical protein